MVVLAAFEPLLEGLDLLTGVLNLLVSAVFHNADMVERRAAFRPRRFQFCALLLDLRLQAITMLLQVRALRVQLVDQGLTLP